MEACGEVEHAPRSCEPNPSCCRRSTQVLLRPASQPAGGDPSSPAEADLISTLSSLEPVHDEVSQLDEARRRFARLALFARSPSQCVQPMEVELIPTLSSLELVYGEGSQLEETGLLFARSPLER
ncbi:hypothetical protein EJB05_27977, partial [Eragrostis curvula]